MALLIAAGLFWRQRARLGAGAPWLNVMIFGLICVAGVNILRALTASWGLALSGWGADGAEAAGIFLIVIGLARWLPSVMRAAEADAPNAAIRHVTDHLLRATDDRFHAVLVASLRDALDADRVFTGQLQADGAQITVWAVSDRDGPARPFTYLLTGSPCEQALSGQPCVYPDAVGAAFPDDAMLDGFRGYAGAAVMGADGQPLGVLVALFRGPMPNPALARSLLGVFAERAGAEIERDQAASQARAREVELLEAQAIGRMGHWRVGDDPELMICSIMVFTVMNMPSRAAVTVADFAAALHPYDRALFLKRRQAAMATRAPFQLDLRLTCQREGRPCWISFVGRPLHHGAGDAPEYGGVVQDITMRKATELDLLEAQAGRTQFVATMSHELRTPLNPIIGFSALLRDSEALEADREKRRTYVDHIHDSAMHMANLVEDILQISAVELNRVTFDLDDLDLEDFAIAMGPKIKRMAVDAGLTYEKAHGGAATLRADATRLRQILFNLASNAVKHTPPGGRIVFEGYVGNGFGAFAVIDSGRGMDESEIAHLLHPFRQGGDPIARSATGLGLGLAISKALAEGMGGRLVITSRVGAGTRAEIRLPFAETTS